MKATNVRKVVKTAQLVIGTIGLLAASLAADVAFADVSKYQRVLVVVSELDSSVAPELRGLYGAIEAMTQTSLQGIIASDYGSVHYLKNRDATAENYGALLRQLASRPSTLAIDTVMSVHGSPGRLHFADRAVNMASLDRAVFPAGMPANEQSTLRRKLRMMYNLSCFGRSHNATFRAMGYDIVAGSNGVNANAGVEFIPTLTSWKIGGRFVDGFNPTNNDAALWIADGLLRAAGEWNHNSLAQTDSKKYFAGFTSVRINSDPR
ncbi:hypothetical protein BH10BDE1_BH10BDE1_17110 [soil metagenome]